MQSHLTVGLVWVSNVELTEGRRGCLFVALTVYSDVALTPNHAEIGRVKSI